ncbi:MAG: hypothetical protein ACYC3E_00675 [Carboxydocellales bacterium]
MRYKLLPEKIGYLLEQYSSLLEVYQAMGSRTEEILQACQAREWVKVEELCTSREQFIANATKIQNQIREIREEFLALSVMINDTDGQLLEVARQTGTEKELKAILDKTAVQLLAIRDMDNEINSSLLTDIKVVQSQMSDLKQYRRMRRAYLNYPNFFSEAVFFDEKE